MDLYAGTGSLGIEALSRGAGTAAFVDKSSECSSVIKENLIHTKLQEKAFIFTGEVSNLIKKISHEGKKFDIIFLDPPYHKNLIEGTLTMIMENGIIKEDGIIVAERDTKDQVPEEVGNLSLVRNQKYGDTVLSFYAPIKM